MRLTKEERVLKTIKRQDIDYLPSQLVFADRSRFKKIAEILGLSSEEDLDTYLENHMYPTFTQQDKPMMYRDVKEEIEKLKEKGYAFPDWENNVVYDLWGIGYKVGVGSFFVDFHPLQGKMNGEQLRFMPDRITDALKEKNIKNAVKKYKCPDPYMENNFSDWIDDLEKYSGNFLVWPIGYAGIYERSYHILGWEELMTYIATEPEVVTEIFDKVTEYKAKVAKKIVELGFKIGHSGDDFGTQASGFFSESMFKKIILPRLKEHWKVFTDAGIPVMFHSCGNITQYIPYLIDIGLTILEPTQPVMNLEYLKKEYGKDLIFYGGINTQKLPYMNAEQTKKHVRDTIRILGKGGGYIISTSQEIMNDVPLENVKVLIETIKEEREKAL